MVGVMTKGHLAPAALRGSCPPGLILACEQGGQSKGDFPSWSASPVPTVSEDST